MFSDVSVFAEQENPLSAVDFDDDGGADTCFGISIGE
jgi:hypothetical protein